MLDYFCLILSAVFFVGYAINFIVSIRKKETTNIVICLVAMIVTSLFGTVVYLKC